MKLIDKYPIDEFKFGAHPHISMHGMTASYYHHLDKLILFGYGQVITVWKNPTEDDEIDAHTIADLKVNHVPDGVDARLMRGLSRKWRPYEQFSICGSIGRVVITLSPEDHMTFMLSG